MRLPAVSVSARLSAALLAAGALVLAPAPARATTPAIVSPTSAWVIDATTRILVRLCELSDWAVEDLNAQLDRRRRWNPPPPVLAPPPAAVASGGSTTAPVVAARVGSMAGWIP